MADFLRVTQQLTEVLGSGDGVARVTQQFTEILGAGTGKSRVTQQFVEVLSENIAVHNESIEQSLVINDIVNTEYYKDLDETLTITDEGVGAKAGPILISVLTELQILDSLIRVHTASVEDELVFNEDVNTTVIAFDFWPVGDSLDLQQDVFVEAGNWKVVEETLQINQEVLFAGPIYQSILTILHLNETLDAVYTKRVNATTTLTFSELAGRVVPQTVNQTLSLTEDLSRLRYAVSENFAINQSVTFAKSKDDIIDVLQINQTVVLENEFVRAIVDNTNLGHALTYYLIDPCSDKSYSPFIGESTINPTTIDTELPLIQGLPEGVRFRLAYPARGGILDQVDLRSPNFDNIDRLSMDRINRETRGGNLIIFADPNWPKSQKVSVTFSGLTITEINSLQAFISNYLGQAIHITDWEGREWEAVITTPNEPFTEDGKNCSFSIGFEFEGVLYDSFQPGESLGFQQSASYVLEARPTLTDVLALEQNVIYWHIPA